MALYAATANAPLLSSHVKSMRQAGVVTQEARYLQQQGQQQQWLHIIHAQLRPQLNS
jgi:hypothetical protein